MKALSGKQKVAILLSTLDTDVAAQIIKNFNEVEIAQISAEIGRLEGIDEGTVKVVLDEFSNEVNGNPTFPVDFSNSFRKLLERTLGLKKTEEILNGAIKEASDCMPFQTLKELDSDALFNTLQEEHPQTIALVLSYLEPVQAAEVLTKFPVELQADVIMRIVGIKSPSGKLVMQASEIIESKVKHIDKTHQEIAEDGRLKTIAKIMSMSDGNTEKAILDIIAQKEPALVEKVRDLFPTFEDIPLVEDRALRKVLSELDNRVVAMALKTASENVVKKVFSNMSQRVGQSVREEWELMGPKPLSEVDAAQREIVRALRNLESQGEKVLNREGVKAEQLV